MENTSKKWLKFSLVIGTIAAILISNISFSYSCEDMYDNIMRIRIIANSNNNQDQTLKLKIRDAVLESSKELFKETKSYQDAQKKALENIDLFKQTAENVVKENGLDYNVNLSIKDEFFSTRDYDNFTLPAGTYKSLVFTLGEGKGENWWCVLFPPLCFSNGNAVEDFGAKNEEKVTVKFKITEVFQEIKYEVKNIWQKIIK